MRLVPRLIFLLAGAAAIALMAAGVMCYRPFSPAPPVHTSLPDPESLLGAGRAARITVESQTPGPTWLHVITEGIPTPLFTETTNILLAGIDTRPWMYGGRTDALLVLVLDDTSGHLGLVSIPRDLLVAVPDQEPNRINTVYATGLRQGGPERGVELLKQVMLHAVGLPLHHVVFVDHSGFESLVDQLGGITVEVACPIQERFLDPRGPGGRMELLLDAGVQNLDGRTALMYARARHGRGFHDRARRQQEILLGLRDRLLELGLPRVKELAPALTQTVFTDLSTLDILKLALKLSRVKRPAIHGLLLGPEQALPLVLDDGRWVMIPDPAAISRSLAGLFEAGPPGQLQPQEPCPPMAAGLQPREQAMEQYKLHRRSVMAGWSRSSRGQPGASPGQR